MAVMLLESAGHRFIPQRYALCRLLITFDDTGTRHQHSYVDTVRRRSLCFRALIVTYRLWQLHERKVSEPEQGTFRDFLNDRNGWRNATLIAVTSKQY